MLYLLLVLVLVFAAVAAFGGWRWSGFASLVIGLLALVWAWNDSLVAWGLVVAVAQAIALSGPVERENAGRAAAGVAPLSRREIARRSIGL